MNAPVKIEPVAQRVRHQFTLDDVFKMQEHGILKSDPKVELIEGDIVQVASQNAPHMLAKQALNRLLIKFEPDIAYHIDGTLRLAPKSDPDPDVFVHPPRIRPDKVRGPDTLLVIEVSDTTLREDLGIQADLYAKYGVPEYWVLDCNSRNLHVHLDPWPDGYALRRIVHPDESVSPQRLPQFTLRVADLPDWS